MYREVWIRDKMYKVEAKYLIAIDNMLIHDKPYSLMSAAVWKPDVADILGYMIDDKLMEVRASGFVLPTARDCTAQELIDAFWTLDNAV